MRRVLLLGSGLTSAPLVSYLTRGGDISLTVASSLLSQAEHLASTYQNTTARALDVQSEKNLDSLIREHELVISHIPYSYHPLVARHCLANGKNMVTSSYVSPAMQALHQSAVDKGLVIVNEVGLDPGIDHMLAMQCFHDVHSRGGQIVSLESWCGGLPHPVYANNPLKYKFSWSPSGVFLAAKNSARYLRDNKLMEIAEGKIMHPENVVSFGTDQSPLPDTEFEGYYNRDSTKYRDKYEIPEAETVIRGTYRYKGCCKVVQSLLDLGLLDTKERDQLQRSAEKIQWKHLLDHLASQSVLDAVKKDPEVSDALQNLGLLSAEAVEPHGSPFQTLCAHMERRLSYEEGEKDAIYLHHSIGIKWPDNKKETRHIDLTVYGTFGVPGHFTAMAQTVGLPLAIAAKMVLDGELKKTGVVIPTSRDLYEPILEKLKLEGIVAKTTSTKNW